jgi:hypothetical protein
MTYAKENGQELWYVVCKKSVWGRLAHDSCKRNIKIYMVVSIISGMGAVICTAVVVAQCNGR